MAELRLIGSKLTSFSGKREPEFSGQITINTEVKMLSMEYVKNSKDTLNVEYIFSIDYKELGAVQLQGNIFISAEARSIKDILKSWKAKKFDSPEYLALTNMIMQKSSIKAFAIEDELGLPIHIRMPTIELKKE